MRREFLEGLGLDKTVIDQILDENSRDIGREKQKTETAQTEINTLRGQLADKDKDIEALKAVDTEGIQQQLTAAQSEIEQYKTQIADRDYLDAAMRSITSRGIKFSSKAAERAYIADLKEKRLEPKDGELVGFDDYHKAKVEDDPSAFQPDKPAPVFVKPVGAGGKPTPSEPENVTMAKAMGAAKAATLKASNDVFNHYT